MIRFAPQLLASVALALTPAAALARSTTGVATLAPGTAHPARLVIDGKPWRCADGVCRGAAELRAVAIERTCKDLTRQLGAIETLAIGGMTLDRARLAECNPRAAERVAER